MSDEAAQEAFIEYIDSLNWGFRRCVRTYLALRDNTGWNLHWGMVALTSESLASLPSDVRVETSRCKAGRESTEIQQDDLEGLIAWLREDPITLKMGNESFRLPSKHQYGASYLFHPVNHPRFPGILRTPGLSITAQSERSVWVDARFLDLELRAHDVPFDGIQDLFPYLGIPNDVLEHSVKPHIDVIALSPIQYRLPESRIEDRKKLFLKLDLPDKPELGKLRIGIRSFLRGRDILRQSVSGNSFNVSTSANGYLATLQLDIPESEFVHILPSYDDHNIGAFHLNDPSAIRELRSLVHKGLFEDIEISSLFTPTNQNDFEGLVAILLHLMNLSVVRYGDLGVLRDGPDMVAISSAGHVYVVECTVGDPDHKGKLHKLHTRTSKVIESFRSQGFDANLVRPVVVSAMPRASTTEHWKTLANYGITLICKEELQGLISRIGNPPSEQQLFKAANSGIPSPQSEEEPELF